MIGFRRGGGIPEARRAWGARKEEHREEIGKFRGEHAELPRR